MYNLLFGTNPIAPFLLGMLGLNVPDVGRFRDAFVTEGKIAVYTRNGGGNREHWDYDLGNETTKESGAECSCSGCIINYRLPKHPNYLYDRDDDFDSTYATIYFSFPDEWKELLEKVDSGEPFDPDERWLQRIEALKGEVHGS
tara:strand:+ start:2803 stop:3231 length:429 start_codon:yes stop_codon:yes gene_type:complete